MPLQVIESTDPLASIVRFETSPVYEMIISLSVLVNSVWRPEWAAQLRESLPDNLVQEAEALYGAYYKGYLFFELAVDYPDHQDVPGFIQFVRDMSPEQFIFYLAGRIVPVESIAATGLEPEAVYRLLDEAPYETLWTCADVLFDAILADVPAFQERLARLWEGYWETCFGAQVESLRARWESALREKEALFHHQGGQALLEAVTGKAKLPPPLPSDEPVRDVVFIPLYFAPAPIYMFYGYGNVTVLFDCELTEARVAEIEHKKERTLAMLKALGDSTRLEILRLIARHEDQINGKRLAAKLKLSPSAVSRHLAQLKEAGLLVESSVDNRTITYRLQREALTGLPDMLLEVLYY